MSSITKYRTCNLCEALCGLEIQVENNQILSIRGDKKDVFSRGHICPKAVALKDIHEDPDRLKFPMVKKEGAWTQVSWEEAFQFAAKGLHDIQQKYGNDSVAVYQGNPSVHNIGTTMFSPNLVRALKTKNRYSATSVDQLAHHLAGEYMFGHQFLVPVPDINRTDFWLILGGNPLVSNGSLMTAPDVGKRLKEIQKRGGKVVVVDPRRTETAEKADQHLFIRPGTDIWLLLAMLNYVLEEDLIHLRHLSPLLDAQQIEDIHKAVEGVTIEKAADLTGISEGNLLSLFKAFTSADSAVVYGRLGVSATRHGGLSHWAINTINILTGNFDRPGGAMLSNPVVDLTMSKSAKKRFRRWKSRVRGLPEFGGELPSNTLAEDILTPGEGQIKAILTSCGNPVLSVPNGRSMDQALASLDFMVSIDIFLNETTRHSDVILPPATGVETPHFGIAFHNLAIHNSAKYSEPSVEKAEGTRYDWEIFSGLLQAYEKLSKSEGELSPQFTLEQMISMALMSGSTGLTLDDLKAQPHGVDLGPHQSILGKKLKTANGTIDLFPEIYKQGLAMLFSEQPKQSELTLIGRRQLRSNNSWLHNSYRMVKGRERCTMLIHPVDASARNINHMDLVKVSSSVGVEVIKAEISDEIMQGVVSIPHGWGHNREGTQLKVANAHAGTSINDLIDEKDVDPLCGVAVINGTTVQVDLYKQIKEV